MCGKRLQYLPYIPVGINWVYKIYMTSNPPCTRGTPHSIMYDTEIFCARVSVVLCPHAVLWSCRAEIWILLLFLRTQSRLSDARAVSSNRAVMLSGVFSVITVLWRIVFLWINTTLIGSSLTGLCGVPLRCCSVGKLPSEFSVAHLLRTYTPRSSHIKHSVLEAETVRACTPRNASHLCFSVSKQERSVCEPRTSADRWQSAQASE
jgi:hypothetical protein